MSFPMFRSSSWWGLATLFLVALFLCAFPGSERAEGHPTRSYPPAPSTPSAARKVLVETDNQATLDELARQGGTLLVDYGAFSLWRVPSSEGADVAETMGVTLDDTIDTIFLRGATINTANTASMASGMTTNMTTSTSVAIDPALHQTRSDEPQLWLVQFVGPLKEGWLQEVEQTGMELVIYMPSNAYLVWGNGAALTRLEELAARSPFVQWTGPYHPAYRLAPPLRQAASTAETANPTGLVAVSVQLYTTAAVEQSLNRLRAWGGEVYASPVSVLNFTTISLQLPAEQISTVATWPDVYNIEPWHPPELFDEVQGQIVAGNVITISAVTNDSEAGYELVPSAPGYLDWLAARGFTTDPMNYPIVDITDDGLDIGDPDNVRHPDFYEFGDPTRPDRVAYIVNCSIEELGSGVGGHGDINAGIVAGYNDLSGSPYLDEQGYNRGLGISPYSRIASTKIFKDSGRYDLYRCGSMETFVTSSFTNGAAITSNSWGHWYFGLGYDVDAQLYDAFTRDASVAIAGNQQMLHVFSAGNSGTMHIQSIGSPGLAKNVLTVGATESVRDDGVYDGCLIKYADSADDMAYFSSRGATADGRNKPDLVAPGTHIQGPASQALGFEGNTVCGSYDAGPYYPPDQTLYTWSSGTSHSAPAVSGAASLATEYYTRLLNPGQVPSPAMLKALLINSTDYMRGYRANDTLPGESQGWGRLNIGRLFSFASFSVHDQNFVFDATGQEYGISSKTLDPTQPLHVTLVWTDPPGSTTGGAWVNDLDLSVTVGGTTYRGNVFEGAFSAPGGNRDKRNNVENVFLPPMAWGTPFIVQVVAKNIAGDGVPGNNDPTDQDFALVISNDANGKPSGGMLEGTIRDQQTNEPVVGASMWAIGGTITTTMKTGKDGSFFFALPVGNYALEADAYGYASQTFTSLRVEKEQTLTQTLFLEPLPRVAVAGRVSDADGHGAPLYARIKIKTSDTDDYEETVFTNPQTGAYQFSLVPGIPYQLTANAITAEDREKDYYPHTRTVTPSSNGNTEHIVLKANIETCVTPGYARSYTYFEDFQQDNGGFITSWPSLWEWGSRSRWSDDDERVWGTNLYGYYGENEDSILVSPDIDLGSDQGRTLALSWSQLVELDRGDRISVDVSNDGGATWETVYELMGEYYQYSWREQIVFLPSEYAAHHFRIRFRLQSDGVREDDGFYIDNVGIRSVTMATIYQEDFELSNGGYYTSTFSTSGTSSWEWGRPLTGPGVAHSGHKVWATNLLGNFYKKEHSFLISPPIDLSAYPDAAFIISWWQWYDEDESHIRVWTRKSADEPWDRAYTTTGNTNGWNRYSFSLGPEWAVPGFQFRFELETTSHEVTPGFYLDDVHMALSPHACTGQGGGLLVGHISDANTGDPLNEVRVSNEEDQATVSWTRTNDLALDDGFYSLFLPTGTHRITATTSKAPYAPASRVVEMSAGGVVRQDFALPAGRLAAHPPLHPTLPISSRATLPLTLTNSGQVTVTLALDSESGGYTPLVLDPVPLPATDQTIAGQAGEQSWFATLSPDTRSAAAAASAASVDRPASYQPSPNAIIRTEPIDVLLVASADMTHIQAMLLAYPDIRRADYFDARRATPTLERLLAYDAVLVASQEAFADQDALGDVLADYLDAGGGLVQTAPTFSHYYDEEHPGHLQPWQVGGRYHKEHDSPLSGDDAVLYRRYLSSFNEEHPIMYGVSQASDALTQYVYEQDDTEVIARWGWDSYYDNEFVALRGRVVGLNTFVADGYSWTGDIPLIVHNSLMWLQEPPEQEWLSLAPITGTLRAESSLPITVTFDPVRAHLVRPGDYHARLLVTHDTPYDNVDSIPITMTLKAEEHWGSLTGIVTSTGYCGNTPFPLNGVNVLVRGSDGTVWNQITASDGRYQFWLDEASGPFTIEVAPEGHQSARIEGVDIRWGRAVQQDIEMVWEHACLQTSQNALSGRVARGGREVVSLGLSNNGTIPIEVSLQEKSLGVVGPGLARAASESITRTGSPIPTGSRSYAAGVSCDGQHLYIFGGWNGNEQLEETWMYTPASDTWTAKSSIPVALSGADATCIGHLIFLIHRSALLIYDTQRDSWETTSLPSEVSWQSSNVATAAWGGNLYAFSIGEETWRYNPFADEWTGSLAKRSTDGEATAMAIPVGDYIYVIEGQQFLRYQPAHDRWDTRGPDLHHSQNNALVVWFGNNLYVINGSQYGNTTKIIQAYDPSQWPAGEWNVLEEKNMVLPASGMAGDCVAGRIWGVGGWYGSGYTSITRYLNADGFCHQQDGQDLSWLSSTPDLLTAASIAPGETLTLTLTLDASVPAAGEPGDYLASLVAQSNDVRRPQQMVSVTMEVIPPLYLPLVQR